MAYQNITARQYVRNVDRLHRGWKSGNQNRKDEHPSCCSKVEQLTANYRFEVSHHDHRKNAQMQRKRKACRYVRNPRKGVRRESGQTKKSYSEESQDDNADSTDRGVPLRQYDPKLIRSGNNRQGHVPPNVKKENQDITRVARTRRRGGTCSHHAHDAGGRWSKKNSGKPVTFLEAHHISEAAKQRRIVC